MKIVEPALLLVMGTVLLTFSAISFGLFPRSPTFSNPTLLVEALAAAGLVFFGLGARGLYRVHRTVSGNGSLAPSRGTTA